MSELIRTRFGNDIVAEVAFPSRRSKKGDKVIVLCVGMPTMPGKYSLLEFLNQKGYTAVYPRYRGTWESKGQFLRESPKEDIKYVLERLKKPFLNVFNGKQYNLRPCEVILLGSSFGGPAALLLSDRDDVDKVVVCSPVVDWRIPSKKEPLNEFHAVVKDAFGEGFRVKRSDWNKLKRGNFYNPSTSSSDICGEKVLILHAKDDEVVAWRPVERFAWKIGAQLILRKRGGHLGTSALMKLMNWKRVHAFLSS
jgi:alpha-beta hydrolase superfamily lysophospholipase